MAAFKQHEEDKRALYVLGRLTHEPEYHKKSAALKYAPAMAVVGENTQDVQLLAEAAELNAAAASTMARAIAIGVHSVMPRADDKLPSWQARFGTFSAKCLSCILFLC